MVIEFQVSLENNSSTETGVWNGTGRGKGVGAVHRFESDSLNSIFFFISHS